MKQQLPRARKGTYAISMSYDSGATREVTGTIRGLFAMRADDEGEYTVTHLPTGYVVLGHLPKRDAERLIVECLCSGLNWKFKTKQAMPWTVKRWGKATKERYEKKLGRAL